jgi:hypothetical protein
VSFFNRMALLSAAAIMVGSVGLSALPANAATARPIGAILCSGDLCVQTDSCPTSDTVSIHEWPDKTPIFGHFELKDPNGVNYNSKPPGNHNYSAGGPGYVFTVPLRFGEEYHGIAWKYADGKYYNIGEVPFDVVTCK